MDGGENESEQNSSDSEYEDEEGEEEVEPRLKYDRISNDLDIILSKDAASCLAVHTKFMALGTRWGNIHILDLQGNSIRNDQLPTHSTTVNQISIDDCGDYLASCSDDGKVVISGLYSSDDNQIFTCDRPVKAVALDPHYGKAGSRSFVTGDENLVLSERGFLGRKTTMLHNGEGLIRNIKWRGSYIAWANDRGVKIYDTTLRQRITFVSRENETLRADQYRCNLCWKDDQTLIIGWADNVKVCKIKTRTSLESDLPPKCVEIVVMFKVEYYLSGIAPYDDNLALLGFTLLGDRPQLRLVEGNMSTYTEVTNDALSLRDYDKCQPNDYRLESLPEDGLYFILSPKDFVIGRPRDQDDHITWLVQHYMFEEAMIAATEHQKYLKIHKYKDLAAQYMASLLLDKDYNSAAKLCAKVHGKDSVAWESALWQFHAVGELSSLAPYLPKGSPALEPICYELTAKEYIKKQREDLVEFLITVPSRLYNPHHVITDILDKLERDRNNSVLLKALAFLYQETNDMEKAISVYIRLKSPDVFDLITKHKLVESMIDKVVLLMDFDKDKTIRLLLDNIDKAPVEKVFAQLEKTPYQLFLYLEGANRRDPSLCSQYHSQMIHLFADFDKSRLMSFLRSGARVNLQEALKVFQERNLTKELVYILDRMGNTKEALQLIMFKHRNVEEAIQFCTEHTDQDLWQDLIQFSIDKPDFIITLLENIGPYVDPEILIKKIQPGMTIPGLQQALVKILQDYNLQINLREVYKKIVRSDCHNLCQQQIQAQRKAVRVELSQPCQVCHQRIVSHDLRMSSNILTFFCGHVYHEECVTQEGTCEICYASVK